MSKFLAPIHSWLFNKIRLSEDIEKNIIDSFKLRSDLNDQHFVAHLLESIGPHLTDEPIENIIDPSNIHGWLQDRIHKTEQRSAALVTYVVQRKPGGLDQLKALYETVGINLGTENGFEGSLSPETAFKKIHDILLEGMPCDRVQQVVAQDSDHMKWHTLQCLHAHAFEAIDGDVANYYTLREVLVNALLSGTTPQLSFNIVSAAGPQDPLYTNTIQKK